MRELAENRLQDGTGRKPHYRYCGGGVEGGREGKEGREVGGVGGGVEGRGRGSRVEGGREREGRGVGRE